MDDMGAADLSVTVVVLADDVDPENGDRLVRRLRAELAELDAESVTTIPAGTVPPGAKSGDPATLGAIVIALSATGGVFRALIDTVRDWLDRQPGGHRVSVTIDGDTIELERATAAEQRDLVEGYLRRHTSS